ncbi:MAG: biosynthetic-type acetolactate synthase large subunit [Oscillospiraceae bacterium]|nr:biosynthetic-type acetolactate synthase large subunit [Oscillospiraceae bacterium]
MRLTGSQIVVETLIEQGVRDVFGYPGGQVINLYDALYEYKDKINHILTAHEQGAAHAADGYARATGGVGVVIATSGPGATNLVTGIATAMLDSVPIIAITGNVPQSLIGKDSFQEIDITGVTLPITKHNFFVHDVNDLADTIREAFQIATSGRPGPVLIDIPKDIQISFAEYERKPLVSKFPTIMPNPEKVKKAAEIINHKKRPYIYIGGGVISSNTSKQVLELADKIDAVIGCSLMGISAISTNEERFLGMEGMHGHYASSMAQNTADVIIAIGVRFSDRATGNVSKFAKKADIIHIDVDFAEISKNVEAQLGIRGDLSVTLDMLINEVEKKERPKWMDTVRMLREQEEETNDVGVGLTPNALINEINLIKDGDTIVATDVGQHQMWTAQYINVSKPRTFISSGGLGTMGFGMGAAIGAATATGKKTVLVTGDGSFGMNLNEVVTAVSNNIPLTIVIMNNKVLGMVRQWQTLFFEKHYSNTDLKDRFVDYVKLAEAFGAKGEVVKTVEEFRKAFREAYNSNDVNLIDCRIDKDEFVLPMLPPGGAIDDMITSTPKGGEC